MVKVKTKEEMAKVIVDAFVFHKNADTLYTTPDGNVFEAKNHADFHVSRNPGMKVSPVDRKDYAEALAETEKEKPLQKIVNNVKVAISEATTVITDVISTAQEVAADPETAKTIADATSAVANPTVDNVVKVAEDVIEVIANEPTDADPKYGKMKLDELKAACVSRTIAFDETTAKRKDLILLLEAADASASAEVK